MFLKGDGNWLNRLNDSKIKYNINKQSTINLRPVSVFNRPEKFKWIILGKSLYYISVYKLEVGDYVGNADTSKIFSKGYTSNFNRELIKINEVLKIKPPTYRIQVMSGEIK